MSCRLRDLLWVIIAILLYAATWSYLTCCVSWDGLDLDECVGATCRDDPIADTSGRADW